MLSRILSLGMALYRAATVIFDQPMLCFPELNWLTCVEWHFAQSFGDGVVVIRKPL
jgi:hypothetical protein